MIEAVLGTRNMCILLVHVPVHQGSPYVCNHVVVASRDWSAAELSALFLEEQKFCGVAKHRRLSCICCDQLCDLHVNEVCRAFCGRRSVLRFSAVCINGLAN